MEVMHERVAGLDVHKAMIVACVRLMSGGKITRECRTFETTTSALVSLLEWLTQAGCTHVAMEATGVYWKPVWNILSDGAFELVLANAAHIKNVPGRKTDVNDATWIADLVAFGLIKASLILSLSKDRSRGRDPGAALAAARPQAADPRADPPYSADPEDARRGQHQARFGDQRHHGCFGPQDDRGDDRRRQKSVQTGCIGRPADQGVAQAAL
jgi:hypothetical protein